MKNRLFTDLESTDSMFTKLFEWESPERHWIPKEKSWYVTYSLFFVLLILVAVLISEYILVVAIIAFAFLWFVQGSTPPSMVKHTITTLGIKTYDKLYKWKNIKHFWFSENPSGKILNLEIVEDNKPDFVKRISLLMNHGDDSAIFTNLTRFADYGDKDEIGFNIFVQLTHGKHVSVDNYLQEKDSDSAKFSSISLDKEASK